MPKFFKTIFGQVVVALVVGIVLGVMYPDFATKLKPLGDGFIKLIKLMIAPIIFCVVVHGIAGAGSLKKVGRVGVKAIVYFEVITTIALMLGIALAYAFQPGAGMNIDPRSLDAASLKSYVDTASQVCKPRRHSTSSLASFHARLSCSSLTSPLANCSATSTAGCSTPASTSTAARSPTTPAA